MNFKSLALAIITTASTLAPNASAAVMDGQIVPPGGQTNYAGSYEYQRENFENENFTSFISRVSKASCAILERSDYISGYAVNEAIRSVLPNIHTNAANTNRWMNMNDQLRGDHVKGAMAYDCNNAMMRATTNNLMNPFTFGF